MNRVLLSFLLVPLFAVYVSAQTNWTMGDYDAQRTSWVQSETQFAPPLTMTRYVYPEPLASATGYKTYNIGYADGIVYLAVGSGPFGNAIAAYDYKNGNVLWMTTIEGGGGAVGNDPIITDNRIICGGQGNAVLTGMDRQSGDVVWTRDVSSMYGMSATLYEGRVYVCADSVYRFDPETGETDWIMPTTRTQGSTPALSGNSLVHISNGRIVVRNKDTGEIEWSRSGAEQQGLTIDENRIFVASDSAVLALNLANGGILWTHDVPENLNIGWLSWNALARTDDILLYALWEDNAGNGLVRALDIDDGSVLWTHNAAGEGILSLTIINGYVYFGEWHSRELVALDIDDGREVERISGPLVYTKAIYGDRRMYAAYTFEPLVGGGMAEYTSAAVGTQELAVPSVAHMDIYPNPGTIGATATYSIPNASDVTLRIFDALGREVSTRRLGRVEAGSHTIRLGSTLLPASLSTGVYRVVLRSGTWVVTKNLILRR